MADTSDMHFLCLGISGFYHENCQPHHGSRKYFFYMMVTGLMLAPLSIYMADFSEPVNW